MCIIVRVTSILLLPRSPLFCSWNVTLCPPLGYIINILPKTEIASNISCSRTINWNWTEFRNHWKSHSWTIRRRCGGCSWRCIGGCRCWRWRGCWGRCCAWTICHYTWICNNSCKSITWTWIKSRAHRETWHCAVGSCNCWISRWRSQCIFCTSSRWNALTAINTGSYGILAITKSLNNLIWLNIS